jgi:hypothetical protein
MSVPRPRDGTQVRYLFQNQQSNVCDLKNKFITNFIRGTKLRDFPKLADDFVKEIYKVLSDPCLLNDYDKAEVLEDDVVYHRLRAFYHAEMPKHEEAAKASTKPPEVSLTRVEGREVEGNKSKEWTREDNRLKHIDPLLKHYKRNHIEDEKKVIKYLDIGCNEGAITKVVGDYLTAETIEGCDVFDSHAKDREFTFHLLADHEKFTLDHYTKSSKNFISAFMALHHIEELRIELESVDRILESDGIFLIREHDLNSEPLCAVLDLMHAFYDFVWKEPPTEEGRALPTFRDHFAKYYPQTELRKIIEDCGFKEVCHSNPVGLWRHYQAVFVKREFWESSQARIRRWFPEQVVDVFGKRNLYGSIGSKVGSRQPEHDAPLGKKPRFEKIVFDKPKQ